MHSPYWLVQFWLSLKKYSCLFIPNGIRNHVITYTHSTVNRFANWCFLWKCPVQSVHLLARVCSRPTRNTDSSYKPSTIYRPLFILCFVFGLKACILGSLSTRVFKTRTATGSEPFPLLTCLHSTKFMLLSIFSPLEMISIVIWETPLSWHVKCSLLVAVRVLKTRVHKLSKVQPVHPISPTMQHSYQSRQRLVSG